MISKSEYLADLSHSLKTPMAVISESIDLIEMKLFKEIGEVEAYKGIIERMRRNSDILQRSINNIIESAVIEEKRMIMRPALVSLSEIAEKAVDDAKIYTEKKNLSIKFIDKTKKETVFSDGEMYESIILNLISNSVKYTGENGKIIIKLCESEEMFITEVSDNGCGIGKDRQKRLFKKGGIKRLQEQGSGIGIGLYLVSEKIKLMGGTKHLESEEGKGTKFSFAIPKKYIFQKSKTKNDFGQVIFNQSRVEYSSLLPFIK